jgi:hypothetical protein
MQSQIKSCKDRVNRRKRLQKDRSKVLEVQEQLYRTNATLQNNFYLQNNI